MEEPAGLGPGHAGDGAPATALEVVRHPPEPQPIELAQLRGEERPRQGAHRLEGLLLALGARERERAGGDLIHLLHHLAQLALGGQPLGNLRRLVEGVALEDAPHILGLGGGDGGAAGGGLDALVAQGQFQIGWEGGA
ncbi:hypothetical protein STIAU_4691 [Stigmatella aurantiaca DW4/3-1]|uniref:Uncharacterized protein n=1 Tax=Stigmatella aurantiaca (strain DW4/3-1) TaxID=378806 RepID=Q08MJ2_STIAD|nr:hypothetical protein STIAU_4691 [Stigmatella aurantiaca DW4/3-1]